MTKRQECDPRYWQQQIPQADRKLGHKSLGCWAQAVRIASTDESFQRRLHEAATTYGSESVGADGGFVMPTAFSDALLARVSEESLMQYCSIVRPEANTCKLPIDVDPLHNPSGIDVQWTTEGASLTEVKPALKCIGIDLPRLRGLAPVSDELLEDAPGLDVYLRERLARCLVYAINYGIVQGLGVGQPLGILNSPALISAAAEGGQTADTIVAENLRKMKARLPGQSHTSPGTVWIVHPDCWQDLTEDTNQGFWNDGRLFNHPVVCTEACNEIGDVGDIVLADLHEYALLRREPQQVWSIHMYFDNGVSAFRYTIRIDGQPMWTAAVTSRDGSTTRSPYVALAERA